MIKNIIQILLCCALSLSAATRVIFLPFEDKVKMEEPWNLGQDIPRWYSSTLDTIISGDSTIQCVPYDSVLAVIRENNWKRREYLMPRAMHTLASRFDAAALVTGTVTKFEIVKTAVNADGNLGTNNTIPTTIAGEGNVFYGSGGVTVIGGLHQYAAKVSMNLELYAALSGEVVERFVQSTEQTDGGIKIWLPFQQIDNDELAFDNMARSSFGSAAFCVTLPGALMKQYSAELHGRLTKAFLSATVKARVAAANQSVEYLEGRVLDRVQSDLYINLGSADGVVVGEQLEITRRDHPLMGPAGDTLGWVQVPIATAKIRFVKAGHFSLATVVAESAIVAAGDAVRVQIITNNHAPGSPGNGGGGGKGLTVPHQQK